MQSVDLKKRRRAVKIANAVNSIEVFLPLKVQNCCQTVGQTVK